MQYGARYEEPTGQAVLTKGYNLPADYVIHTVGPIVGGSLNQKLKDDLKSCYLNVRSVPWRSAVSAQGNFIFRTMRRQRSRLIR